MRCSDLMDVLKYIPQDAEIIPSEYGLYAYLYGYICKEPDHGLEVVPSFNLEKTKSKDLPWLDDSSWLDVHRIK